MKFHSLQPRTNQITNPFVSLLALLLPLCTSSCSKGIDYSVQSEYHQLYTKKNSLHGSWTVVQVNTTRTDSASLQLFRSWVENKQNVVTLLFRDHAIDPTYSQTQLKMKFYDQPISSGDILPYCAVTIAFEVTYCCPDMYRVILPEFSSSNYSFNEYPLGCSSSSLHLGAEGQPLESFARGIVAGLTESPTNSLSSIYHFLYNQMGDQALLQSPPPENKFRSISHETQLYLRRGEQL